MSGGPTQTEIKRWALDTSDWLWGTAQGSWNEKQTTSQIIVDAIIGMIPLVGDVTAARDLIHIGTGLSTDEKKREDALQWALFVVLLFALIPVLGGVIKGVGLLLLKMGKTAAENHQMIQEIVAFLNRIGRGNAVRFVKELDFAKYQREIIAKSDAFCDKMVEALNAIKDKLGWFIPPSMAQLCDAWIANFTKLKRLAARNIPQGVKELNQRLKLVQQQVYRGEWHEVVVGQKNVTYEAEARLVEHYQLRQIPGNPGKYPQNAALADDPEALEVVYQHKEGWPDLRKFRKEIPNHPDSYYCPDIASFSGPIKPRVIEGPFDMSRGIGIGKLGDTKGNGPAGAYWAESAAMPDNAQAWRTPLAVLDEFNHNGWWITTHIPKGVKLQAWEGTAAEQFGAGGKQFLEGGGKQLYIDLGLDAKTRAAMQKAFEQGANSFTAPNGVVFRIQSTNWQGVNGMIGYRHAAADAKATTQRLGDHEYASKRGRSVGSATGARAGYAVERDEQKKGQGK